MLTRSFNQFINDVYINYIGILDLLFNDNNGDEFCELSEIAKSKKESSTNEKCKMLFELHQELISLEKIANEDELNSLFFVLCESNQSIQLSKKLHSVVHRNLENINLLKEVFKPYQDVNEIVNLFYTKTIKKISKKKRKRFPQTNAYEENNGLQEQIDIDVYNRLLECLFTILTVILPKLLPYNVELIVFCMHDEIKNEKAKNSTKNSMKKLIITLLDNGIPLFEEIVNYLIYNEKLINHLECNLNKMPTDLLDSIHRFKYVISCYDIEFERNPYAEALLKLINNLIERRQKYELTEDNNVRMRKQIDYFFINTVIEIAKFNPKLSQKISDKKFSNISQVESVVDYFSELDKKKLKVIIDLFKNDQMPSEPIIREIYAKPAGKIVSDRTDFIFQFKVCFTWLHHSEIGDAAKQHLNEILIKCKLEDLCFSTLGDTKFYANINEIVDINVINNYFEVHSIYDNNFFQALYLSLKLILSNDSDLIPFIDMLQDKEKWDEFDKSTLKAIIGAVNPEVKTGYYIVIIKQDSQAIIDYLNKKCDDPDQEKIKIIYDCFNNFFQKNKSNLTSYASLWWYNQSNFNEILNRRYNFLSPRY